MEVDGAIGVVFKGGGKVKESLVQFSKSIPDRTMYSLQGVGELIGVIGSQSLLLDRIGVGEREVLGVESEGLPIGRHKNIVIFDVYLTCTEYLKFTFG